MHKVKIISIAVLVLFAVLYAVYRVQPQKSEIQAIPQSASAHKPIPDFSAYQQSKEKKIAFFDYLKPAVTAQNTHILVQREFIYALLAKHQSGEMISQKQLEELKWLSEEYRVEFEEDLQTVFESLLIRVDIIPTELVLVQSANESAWGTSRFARKGYNFFGLWCFKKGCGFVPKRRNDGAAHEVAKFTNLSTAMYTYMRNLNRHAAYSELRAIRAQLRKKMQPISALALSEGLSKYSERGDDYILELKQMIRVNKELM